MIQYIPSNNLHITKRHGLTMTLYHDISDDIGHTDAYNFLFFFYWDWVTEIIHYEVIINLLYIIINCGQDSVSPIRKSECMN